VYWGTSSGQYSQQFGQGIDAGNNASYVVTGLPAGQMYYFAVTSVTSTGSEGTYSNEASKLVQ
jgi:hypothetical protein